MPVFGYFFDTPAPVEARLDRKALEGRSSVACLAALSLLAVFGAVAIHAGVVGVLGAAVIVSIMAPVQLLQAWLHFSWWRAAA